MLRRGRLPRELLECWGLAIGLAGLLSYDSPTIRQLTLTKSASYSRLPVTPNAFSHCWSCSTSCSDGSKKRKLSNHFRNHLSVTRWDDPRHPVTVMSSSLLKLLEWGRGSNPFAKVDVGSSNFLSRSKDDAEL